MGTFKKFEEIEAWKLSRDLVAKVYSLTKKKAISQDFGFKDQIRRSAVSIMANIAEGFERYGLKEFIQFLNIAKGSSGELRSHLYVALDLHYLTDDEFEELLKIVEKISGQIWKLIEYLKKL